MFRLSTRSLANLHGVHPDLVAVVRLAIELTPVDFIVTEGHRSSQRQAALMQQGKTQTLNSRHLTGHAVDVAALVDGSVNWDMANYRQIAAAMKNAAQQLNIPIEWGGDWKSFKDGPHFQLPFKDYP